MCGRFLMVPKEVVDDIIREIEIKNAINVMPDWPARPQSAYPKSEVSVITPGEHGLISETMTWGYEVPWNKGVIFNTRCDTALKPGRNMWAGSLANRRCIVPSFGFFEPHQNETFIDPMTGKTRKQQYLFSAIESPILFLAAVHDNRRMSLMTTEPTDAVRPIHNRMPVVLRQCELDTWLTGDYRALFDRRDVSLKIISTSC